MKVKIIKANLSSYWYATHIGSIFEVLDRRHRKSNGTMAYCVKSCPADLIDVDDAVIIDEKIKVMFS